MTLELKGAKDDAACHIHTPGHRGDNLLPESCGVQQASAFTLIFIGYLFLNDLTGS